MATPNLGLTIPVGGTTPGAANNTTAGTYPFIIAADLNLIDANCLSIPNNPAKISNGGIVIDGNVPFGGFGITGASTASFSSTVGIAGLLSLTGAGTALSVTNNATVSGTLTVGTLALTNLSLSGTLGVSGLSTLAGISMSGNITSTASANFSIVGPTGFNILINAATGEGVAIQVAGTTVLSATSASVAVSGVPIIQTTASTALTITGSAPATGGNGIIANTGSTTLTSGNIMQFQNNSVVKGSIDFAGKFLSLPGDFFTSGANTVTLKGAIAAAGIGAIIDNTNDVGGTGTIVNFSTAGTAEFAISGRAHLIPLSTAPSAGTFASGYGTVTGITVTGGDASFKINFTTGTATAITYGTALMVVTLNQAYAAAATANAWAAYSSAPAAGAADQAGLYAVFTLANQITIYAGSGSAVTSFTPQSTHAYSIAVHTMGAGSSS